MPLLFNPRPIRTRALIFTPRPRSPLFPKKAKTRRTPLLPPSSLSSVPPYEDTLGPENRSRPPFLCLSHPPPPSFVPGRHRTPPTLSPFFPIRRRRTLFSRPRRRKINAAYRAFQPGTSAAAPSPVVKTWSATPPFFFLKKNLKETKSPKAFFPLSSSLSER